MVPIGLSSGFNWQITIFYCSILESNYVNHGLKLNIGIKHFKIIHVAWIMYWNWLNMVPVKVQVFNTFVLLHFVYRANTWNVTQSQQHQLEAAYNNYLRGMMGIHASDWHNLQHIWSICKVKLLVYLLVEHRLNWLGHVARLSETRYPHIALFAH